MKSVRLFSNVIFCKEQKESKHTGNKRGYGTKTNPKQCVQIIIHTKTFDGEKPKMMNQ